MDRIVLSIMCCFVGFLLATAIYKESPPKVEECIHSWKQGVSFDECKEVSNGLKLSYPRSFYKCTNCNEIEVTVNSVRP